MTFKKRLRTNAIQNIWRVFPKIIDKIYKRELVCFVKQMFFFNIVVVYMVLKLKQQTRKEQRKPSPSARKMYNEKDIL